MFFNCTNCELGCADKACAVQGEYFLHGQDSARVMIIGDFPHGADMQLGRPFSGNLGQELVKVLSANSIPLNCIYVTTLVKCRPVGANQQDGTIKKDYIDKCKIYLDEEIINVNPEIVVLFGEKVFRAFFPKLKFSGERGKILKHPDYDLPMLATYNPLASIMSSKFDPIIRRDFYTLSQFLNNKEVSSTNKKDYMLLTDNINMIHKLVERMKTVDTFAFDIETHGSGLFKYKMLSIAFSWKKDTGVAIPIYEKDPDLCNAIQAVIDYCGSTIEETTKKVNAKTGAEKVTTKKRKVTLDEVRAKAEQTIPQFYTDEVKELTTVARIKNYYVSLLDKNPPLRRHWGDKHDEVMQCIKEIMESPVPKGAHNGSYDVNRLRGIGITVNNYAWDTILMHHMEDEERGHGLDELSELYTNDGGYKKAKDQYLTSSQTSWANIPLDVLLPYNAGDADVTLQLYHKFKDVIYKDPVRVKLFEKHIMPAQRMLCDMEFRGSNIDKAWVRQTTQEYLARMHDLKLEFSSMVAKVIPNVYVVDSPEEQKAVETQIKESHPDEENPTMPFFLNMNSVQQLVVLFRDYYKEKLEKTTATGVALDSAILTKIAKHNKTARVLLEYKKLKKLESTYLSGILDLLDADDKLHTQFLLYGTKTSRLASRSPNLQNFPGDMKPMFIPPSKEYLCVNVDQSAAELHVMAWMAQDKKMMDIFEKHRDLHRETAAGVFNKKPEDITDQERKIAKRCFSSDTFILTKDGYVRGKDIGNRKVYTLDGKLQNQHHVFEERDGLKITLRNGMKLRVTSDHKFLDFSHVVPTWKQANEFKVGDVIGTLKNVVPLKPVYLDNAYKLGTHFSRFPKKIELDADLAYLMGIYLGDGSMVFDTRGEATQVQLIIKRGSRDHILQTLKEKYPITTAREFATYSSVKITSKEIAQLFYKHLGHTKTKHVPDVIFKCDKSIVNHFISGLIDSDGSTSRGLVRFRNTNENMVRGLCQLATLNGYAVVYGTEKYDTTIKMNKDPNKRYTGTMHICTFVSKPNLTLYVENKKEGLQRKKDTNERHRWFINKKECKEAVPNRGSDTAWGNYRDGNMKGITDAVVTRWGFEHKNYWAQEIVKIEQDRFETLIMETDTHFFVGNAVRSPNCSFGTAYGISGPGLVGILEPEGIKISATQGDKYIEQWKKTYPGCARFLRNAIRTFKTKGYLETPFGRRRHKYKVYTDSHKEAASDRQSQNFPIQSTASDIQLYEMVHMYPELLKQGILPVLTVHDSIVMYCPKDKLEWLRKFYEKETCRRFENDEFPGLNGCLMYTEMEVGRNYGEHIKLPYDCDFNKWKEEHKELFE